MEIKLKKDELKQKVNEVVEKGKEKLKKIGGFFGEHPETIPASIMFGLSVITAIAGAARGSSQKQLERCKVEDDVTGLDFLTTHPMTNGEILELGERMIDGQPKGDALADMGLLKKEKRRK